MAMQHNYRSVLGKCVPSRPCTSWPHHRLDGVRDLQVLEMYVQSMQGSCTRLDSHTSSMMLLDSMF